MKKLKHNHAIADIVKRYANDPYCKSSVEISEAMALPDQEPVRVTEAQPGGGCGLFVRFTPMQEATMTVRYANGREATYRVQAGFDAVRYRDCMCLYDGPWLSDDVIGVEFVGEYAHAMLITVTDT